MPAEEDHGGEPQGDPDDEDQDREEYGGHDGLLVSGNGWLILSLPPGRTGAQGRKGMAGRDLQPHPTDGRSSPPGARVSGLAGPGRQQRGPAKYEFAGPL